MAVDHFSKYVIIAPMKNMNAEMIAQFILYRIGLIFGFLNKLLSDRGSSFLSRAIQQLLSLAESKKTSTTAYHPQGGGQAESAVKIVTRLLCKMVATFPNLWVEYVPFITFQYNCSVQDSVRVSSYMVVFGQLPRVISLDPSILQLTRFLAG